MSMPPGTFTSFSLSRRRRTQIRELRYREYVSQKGASIKKLLQGVEDVSEANKGPGDFSSTVRRDLDERGRKSVGCAENSMSVLVHRCSAAKVLRGQCNSEGWRVATWAGLAKVEMPIQGMGNVPGGR